LFQFEFEIVKRFMLHGRTPSNALLPWRAAA
jgi:hypothetical protein